MLYFIPEFSQIAMQLICLLQNKFQKGHLWGNINNIIKEKMIPVLFHFYVEMLIMG